MTTKAKFTATLIVNTYNQVDYLERVLAAFMKQSVIPSEILIADDGSEDSTRVLVENWICRAPVPCRHLWQPHQGFRKARILNQAIATATGDYLIFLDGDSIPHPHFLRDHCRLARSGSFVQGHRCLIEREASRYFGRKGSGMDRLRAIAQFQLSGIQNAFRWPFPIRQKRCDLEGIRGCNFAAWRSDLLAVNGYNEEFEGWGREDSELVVRLLNSGLRRVDVRGWALCYHLWHPPASRSRLELNDDLLTRALVEKIIRCQRGVDQHLSVSVGC